MNKYRTHNCGELRDKNAGEEVLLAGWVQTIRDHGGLVFIDLRDQYGITQIVTSGEDKLVDELSRIPNESTVSVKGTVRKRTAGMENKNMPTGTIEVVIKEYEILGKRLRNLPFEVNEDIEVREDLRLQYRFLDLRNDKLKNNIIFRSKVIKAIRESIERLGFVDIQTPILTSSSPEGARDYLVPSRIFSGEFYALPQAPQIYKQLLMVSGFDRYYQIAPCFRDEDPRADRLPGEFYQLDLEMAFAEQDDVFNVVETVLNDTFGELSKWKKDSPKYKRLPYREAIRDYGTDKPDLRNPLILKDATQIFQSTEFNAFKGKTVKVINVPDIASQPRSFFDGMGDFAVKELGAKGLAWLKVNDDASLSGPIAKFIDDSSKNAMFEITGSKPGDCIFFIAEAEKTAEKQAGVIRDELGKRLDILEKEVYRFCWITDFPMYELNDEGKIEFGHNPFSMPQGGMKSLLEKEPVEILAHQYDLVCNGYEIASGAVRNHNPELMIKAFEIAGYSKEVVESKFPALWNAFHYGPPPHGGCAPGIDRIVMLLADETNIRQVVAFPKNGRARDLLMGAPSGVTKEQLKELHIKIDEKV
ncbi:MAG: aspartate--tRNA ligase [Firmicutes bacterium]|nr:aspartate--tRNA ligase [Bacillota bacterium]